MHRSLSRVEILGVHLSPITRAEVIDAICQSAASRQRLLTAYANAHTINLAQELPWFRDFLNQADITYCDGYGVLWGARLLGQHLPERFTPPDWFPELAAACTAQRLSFFFLGARAHVLEKTTSLLKAQIPDLRIAGMQPGYFDNTPRSAENEQVIAAINDAGADILVVGMGQPLQERWLLENWAQLNPIVALPVGAMFDYLAGETRRAPRWLTDHGLEWLGRLLVEPARLGRRYVLGNPRFLWRVLRQRLGEKPR